MIVQRPNGHMAFERKLSSRVYPLDMDAWGLVQGQVFAVAEIDVGKGLIRGCYPMVQGYVKLVLY